MSDVISMSTSMAWLSSDEIRQINPTLADVLEAEYADYTEKIKARFALLHSQGVPTSCEFPLDGSRHKQVFVSFPQLRELQRIRNDFAGMI
jgi:hypothetical protein